MAAVSPRGYVGVVGPGDATEEQAALAAEVGRSLAGLGVVLVTGGLGGVMGAAARGCAEGGGTSLGLLPGGDRTAAHPDLSLTVPTGLGEMRNALLVRCCDALVAVGTSWGTLSEVALAARTGVPVFVVDGPMLDDVPDGEGVVAPVRADGPAEAVRLVARSLGLAPPTAPAPDRCVLGVDGERGGPHHAVVGEPVRADLELRLHEEHDVSVRGQERGQGGDHVRHGDEGHVRDDHVDGAADGLGGDAAHVGALQVDDRGVGGDPGVELPVAHVERDHLRCVVPEQGLGESPRRGSGAPRPTGPAGPRSRARARA
jgi:uncharacterized protein (TIGR00725 family)